MMTTAELKKGLGGLATIASAAPFIGLFGTVIGIINAFRGMAASRRRRPRAVSAGIAEALVTTAVGLARRHSGGHGLQLLPRTRSSASRST